MTNATTQDGTRDAAGRLTEFQLTLRTATTLEGAGIKSVAELVRCTQDELSGLGLDVKARIEVREVLASRGF